MALFNVSVWQRSRFTLQWFIINLVGSLACLTAVALAQFEWSEGVSGSVSIPDVAFTSLGNLSVFMTAFIRGRLDMENGARDVLATTRGPKLNAIKLDMENGARDVLATTRGPKLNAINGCGLTTLQLSDLRVVDVVLLSKYNEGPHSSLTQFMQYVSHAHSLESILLQFFPFTSPQVTAEKVNAEKCECFSHCRCVVFRATEEIVIMLARRLPGTLKRLSKSLCLLPSLRCLKNGCHGCDQDLLYVKDLVDVKATGESSELGTSELREDNPTVDSPAAVCEAMYEPLIEEEESSCICIPVHPRNADRWTKLMIKFLKSKEKEAKGIKVGVSDALQNYITGSAQELGVLFQTPTGCIVVSEIYESASLILPRVAEVIVNMGLTGWLRVDGFSSSLVARRAIRDYVVDSAGTGFGANAFLTEAVVFCSEDGTHVCQLLGFRGGVLSARRVSYMVGCVNLICSITWSALVACEGNWSPSMPLSTRRVSVLIGAVGVALGMDCFEVYGNDILAWAQGLAWVLARVWARARARARANRARARLWTLACVKGGAWKYLWPLFWARDWARDQARVRAWSVKNLAADCRWVPFGVRYRYRAPALVRVRVWEQVWIWAENQAWAQARVRARARTRARAPLWGLVVVVILEVVCIASLVVRLSMNKGLRRWVYSGMQVLVWVKWGIGSFLLGDNAAEDEDGSPYVSWIRKRGTWVYCSAFLLNAILAGVRRK